MSTKKDLGQASNGLYFRNLGWKQTPSGCTQQKFYLGRDESKAKLANMRLEQTLAADRPTMGERHRAATCQREGPARAKGR